MSDEWAKPSTADVLNLLGEAFQGNKESDARAQALIAAHITSTLLLAEAVSDLVELLGAHRDLAQRDLAQPRTPRTSGSPGNGVDPGGSGSSRPAF